MTGVIITILVIAAVIIALFLLRPGRKGHETQPPRRMFTMETSEDLAPVESQPSVPTLVPELPDSYNDTRVVLMVRDPEWLFAYWEINDHHWDSLVRRYGEAAASRDNVTLRVFELSGDMRYFDINVGGMARDWHIRVGKSSTPFYCHLGLKYGREFISLAVSNTVVTPRDGLSHLFDDEWMLVNDYEQKLLKRLGDFPLDLTSPFMYRKEG